MTWASGIARWAVLLLCRIMIVVARTRDELEWDCVQSGDPAVLRNGD